MRYKAEVIQIPSLYPELVKPIWKSLVSFPIEKDTCIICTCYSNTRQYWTGLLQRRFAINLHYILSYLMSNKNWIFQIFPMGLYDFTPIINEHVSHSTSNISWQSQSSFSDLHVKLEYVGDSPLILSLRLSKSSRDNTNFPPHLHAWTIKSSTKRKVCRYVFMLLTLVKVELKCWINF